MVRLYQVLIITLKVKFWIFFPGESRKDFEIEILPNKQRRWDLSFIVVLGPDDPVNALLGNCTKAVVTISNDRKSDDSWILPAIPVVVSLHYYDQVEEGMKTDPMAGYPLICITACDSHYPDYKFTHSVCDKSGINISSIYFSWEIAAPLDNDNTLSSFEKIPDTVFSSAHHMVLDSIYFGPFMYIRCITTPKYSNGRLGLPLQSRAVKISSVNGICISRLTLTPFNWNLQSQPFFAHLQYINSSDKHHPNKLHIHIEIPHQDGMLPLISTQPLHNVVLLLTQSMYRQQHACSNIFPSSVYNVFNSSDVQNFGFYKDTKFKAFSHGSGFIRPFQYDAELRQVETLLLYKHLDLKKCTWTFDAWYHVTEIVDLCGGTVTSDFKVLDSDQTFVTVHLPLYVSYVFATAPGDWTSIERQTELEFSFFYNTVLWKQGLDVNGSLKASIWIYRLGINENGQLFLEFKTKPKFHGLFVLNHHTLPQTKSKVIPPKHVSISYDLKLLWTELTFNGPLQLWRASSNYNLKDYSGIYVIELIPCRATLVQPFKKLQDHNELPCIAESPLRFDLPLDMQQMERPVPAIYSLNTVFQIFKDRSLFMQTLIEHVEYMDYRGIFTKGDHIYGRVMWDPDQDLKSAYHLQIHKVILCSGFNDYTPTYDPTGEVYNEGSQYGCLQKGNYIKYKFVLLDLYNPELVDATIDGIPFDAKFARNSSFLNIMGKMNGVDGFVFKVDPLFKVNPSQQWFVQVFYNINFFKKNTRLRRSLSNFTNHSEGTNIHAIQLHRSNKEVFEEFNDNSDSYKYYFFVFLFIICIATFVGFFQCKKITHFFMYINQKKKWISGKNMFAKTTKLQCQCIMHTEQSSIISSVKCHIRPASSEYSIKNCVVDGTEV